MKKSNINLILTLALLLVAHIALTQGPPDPPGDPGIGGPPVGGGASIDGGLGFLIGLATAWGSQKLYQMRKKKQQDAEA